MSGQHGFNYGFGNARLCCWSSKMFMCALLATCFGPVFNLPVDTVVQSASRATSGQPGDGVSSTINLYQSKAQDKAHAIRISNGSLTTAIDIFNGNEFTILMKMRQEPNTAASLIYLEDSESRLSSLELHSRSRQAEVCLYYGDQSGGVRDVIFDNVQLGDLKWHEVALRLSGNQATLYVDCERLGSRNIPDRQKKVHSDARLLLFGKADNFELKGAVEYLRLSSDPLAIQRQCPTVDVECPTCGQFQDFQRHVSEAFAKLEEKNRQLELRVQQMSRVDSRRSSEVFELQRSCLPVCWRDGKRFENGTTWEEGCNLCSCQEKSVLCTPIVCPSKPNCADATLHACCRQSCDRGCFDAGDVVPHLSETYKRSQSGCIVAKCVSGVMSFKNATCEKLRCPEDRQIFKEGSCCPVCREDDHCGDSRTLCVENAQCVGHGFSAKCQCKDGYHGDGASVCEDIDECASTNSKPHHCPENSVCVNTPGNYSCHCNLGFEMDARGFCVDVDECAERNFCDSGATCHNKKGGFDCICPAGYQAEGRSCKPVCESPCRHGGICVAPNRCECRLGYRGSYCEHDVDECQEKSHQCGAHAICINQPGWYSCQCESGFQAAFYNGTAICTDINECLTGAHSCPEGSICRNRESSFSCQCLRGECDKQCSVQTQGRVQRVPNGQTWIDETTCRTCRCTDGALSCAPVKCDCSNPDRKCCPHCFQEEEAQCKFRSENGTVLVLANGQRFVHGCQNCECMFGSLDCWTAECPQLSCAQPVFPGDLCCPVCPREDPCFPSEDHGRGCHYAEALFGTASRPLKGRAATCRGCSTSGHILIGLRGSASHPAHRPSDGVPTSPESDAEAER